MFPDALVVQAVEVTAGRRPSVEMKSPERASKGPEKRTSGSFGGASLVSAATKMSDIFFKKTKNVVVDEVQKPKAINFELHCDDF